MTIQKMETDIKKIWTEQERNAGKQVLKNRIDSVADLNCYIGVIGISGARIFQVEINNTQPVHKNYLRKFKGVEVQVLPKDESVSEFTIILLEKELTDIFTLFIEDLVMHLKAIHDTGDALNIINNRINYWRQLFGRITGEMLSPEAQRGLYGELFFLHLLLSGGGDKNLSLSCWQGANSSNQDFSNNSHALEIKTSKASNSSVFISNESQLDYAPWEKLYLGYITVNESPGQRNTLYEIIGEIKDCLREDSDLVREFEIKLEQVGINNEMVELYNETSYTIRSTRFFEVKNGFPVITKAIIDNDAVFNVKYEINLSSCNEYVASDEEVLSKFL